jgi:hypothetical protein
MQKLMEINYGGLVLGDKRDDKVNDQRFWMRSFQLSSLLENVHSHPQ